MQKLFSVALFLILAAPLLLTPPAAAQVRVSVVVNFAPPELPVYDQPLCPGDGYIWTPGYWAWDGDDYYWVPGTWVMPPEVGFLWTPGYWGWSDGGFGFYEGYWGPVVGFYGGINYGFGYFGHGYEGGRWDHDHFYYNRSVNNINVTEIHNVYNTTVVNNSNVTRVSYNGGNGGVSARPTAQEESAARERHIAATPAQAQQIALARGDRQLKASVNQGKPPVAATPKAGAFQDHAAVPAREGGRYLPPAETRETTQPSNANASPTNREAPPSSANPRSTNREAQPPSSNPRPTNIVHPSDIPKGEPRPAPNTGNTSLDKKYQQQQQKLDKQQEQARQKLQKQQDTEHQKLEKQQANEAAKQQAEQKHQRQTQQLMQHQAQQQQHLQTHQAPPSHPAPAASHPPQGN